MAEQASSSRSSLAPRPPKHLSLKATLATILGVSATYAFGCDGPTCIAAGALAAVTIRIALIDLKLRIICDRDILAMAAIGVAWTLWSGSIPALDLGIGLLRGLGYAGAFQVIRLGYFRLRGRDGLGLGDIKLVSAIGPLLAIDAFAFAVAGAALGGVAFVIARASLKRRSLSRHIYVPLGSALTLANYGAWLTCVGLP